MSTDSLNPETPENDVPATETSQAAETTQAPAATLDIGSEAPAAGSEETSAYFEPTIRGKIDRFGVAWGTGRRKTAVARVRVKEGTGVITINGRKAEDYFSVERDMGFIQAPLKITSTLGKVDVDATVQGGGSTGQTGAVVLGIARALQAKDPALHSLLSEGGFLTRDSRMVERKKYGKKGARRSFQFSKR